MLPGPRIVLVAIVATFAFVVLAFAQLVKLQVAQSRSASFGPVEARFAGLAFAERADWTPVATSRARSMEALAPFGNLSSMQPRRPDREAADASLPIQIAALEQPTAASDAPAIKLVPVTVASIDPAINSEAPPVTPEPAATAEQPPQHTIPETATPEATAPKAAAPETADSPAQGVSEGTETPVVDIAALSPPPTVLTPTIAAQGLVEVLVAAIPAPVDPVPAALATTDSTAAAPAATAAQPEPPKQVASLPDETPSGDAESGATDVLASNSRSAAAPLPPTRPTIAALLPGEIVPVPTPRPNVTFPAQPRRRAVRHRAARAQPQPARLPDPFAALFGGNPTSATNRR